MQASLAGLRRASPALVLAACTGAVIGDPAPRPDGGARDGGGPTIPAPRPRSPASTARTTSRRPSFAWDLAPGTDGARVEICRDRACTRLEQAFELTGTRVAAGAELSPGAHFWRVFGRAGTSTGRVASATWVFFVPRRGSATVDSAWGTAPDFNGDGSPDVAVAAARGVSPEGPAVTQVHVFPGGRGGIPGFSPRTVFTLPGSTGGAPVPLLARAGDVNGDGYADLAVAVEAEGDARGRVHVFLGGAPGLGERSTTTLTGSEGAGAFGSAVAGAGDLDDDGYADLVVGDPSARDGAGAVYVYPGGATGLSTSASQVLANPGAERGFGASVAGVGDLNGDGHPDLVVGATGSTTNAGAVYIYLGTRGGLSPSPSSSLPGRDGQRYGHLVASAGDLNGDGYADLAIAVPGPNEVAATVEIYLGGRAGVMGPRPTVLTMPGGRGGGFAEQARSIVAAGDLNGDGFDELALAAPFEEGGRVYVYQGHSSGVSATPAVTLTGMGEAFGAGVMGPGDLDADGFDDLVVAPQRILGGTVFVYRGRAGRMPRAVDAVLGVDARMQTTWFLRVARAGAPPRRGPEG